MFLQNAGCNSTDYTASIPEDDTLLNQPVKTSNPTKLRLLQSTDTFIHLHTIKDMSNVF
jgi:hypothetical protein